MLGIGEPMPGILGNEYRSTLPKKVLCIVQCENSAAFQNVEGFVHAKVSVYRNARTDRHLLGSQGEIVGACGGADLDEDVAGVAPMSCAYRHWPAFRREDFESLIDVLHQGQR